MNRKPRIRVKAPSRWTADIIDSNVTTTLDQPADVILHDALTEGLTAVAVLGYDANGEEWFATSLGAIADLMLLLRRAEYRLVSADASGLGPAFSNTEATIIQLRPRD